jgi:hydrogenase nickel incorporation protein HypB
MTPRIVDLRKGILEKNDVLAQSLRQQFSEAGVRVSNWVSSPGTGKTALLEAMLTEAIENGIRAAALVGDCATDNDAQRLARSGAAVRQIVTESMCHLEGDMIAAHLDGWDLGDLDLLVIENVGNLVCPTAYDLGEDARVALLSVTEGEDKPAKYPQLFHSADVIVITKIDIAVAVEWDREAALAAIHAVNPTAPVVETSSRTREGVSELLNTLLTPSRQLQEAP